MFEGIPPWPRLSLLTLVWETRKIGIVALSPPWLEQHVQARTPGPKIHYANARARTLFEWAAGGGACTTQVSREQRISIRGGLRCHLMVWSFTESHPLNQRCGSTSLRTNAHASTNSPPGAGRPLRCAPARRRRARASTPPAPRARAGPHLHPAQASIFATGASTIASSACDASLIPRG